MTDSMCQKWFAKFHVGDFSLDDAPWLGRTVEVDRDQIETLIEKYQCSTMQEIADILNMSKSIKLLVKMKNVSFILRKKNPHELFGQPNIIGESVELDEVGPTVFGQGLASYRPQVRSDLTATCFCTMRELRMVPMCLND